MKAVGRLHPVEHGRFPSTHWTDIAACDGSDDAAYVARDRLCKDYWYPVYHHIVRLGNQTHHAEELTQDFFAYILKKNWFARADRSKGRFRSFLLASLRNFLRDQFDRRQVRRREGGYQHIPLGMGAQEVPAPSETGDGVHPTTKYDADWASAVVAAALRQLEEEYRAEGNQTQFERLKRYLTVEADGTSYTETAATLQITVPNVKTVVYRLRQRYKALLKKQVATTVATPEDVEEEMHYLRAVLQQTS